MKVIIRISRDADGYFRAWCPALPGCFAYGPSQDEASAKLDEAIRGYLGSLDAVLPSTLEHRILSA